MVHDIWLYVMINDHSYNMICDHWAWDMTYTMIDDHISCTMIMDYVLWSRYRLLYRDWWQTVSPLSLLATDSFYWFLPYKLYQFCHRLNRKIAVVSSNGGMSSGYQQHATYGGMFLYSVVRRLSNNYQTTIKQLSNNYQTTIKQLRKHREVAFCV